MQSFREQIASREDLREKAITLANTNGDGKEPITATIRRVLVGERKRLVGEYKINSDTPDHVGFGIALVAISLVPAMSIPEVEELPAAIVDELSRQVIQFNGWDKKEQAQLADQFRAES